MAGNRRLDAAENFKTIRMRAALSHPDDKMSLFMQFVLRLEEIASIKLRVKAAKAGVGRVGVEATPGLMLPLQRPPSAISESMINVQHSFHQKL